MREKSALEPEDGPVYLAGSELMSHRPGSEGIPA